MKGFDARSTLPWTVTGAIPDPFRLGLTKIGKLSVYAYIWNGRAGYSMLHIWDNRAFALVRPSYKINVKRKNK